MKSRRTWWNSTSNAVYLSGLAFSMLIYMFLIIYHYHMWHKPANRISDTLTAYGQLLYRSPMLSHIDEWKNKPKKGSYLCIAHTCRHFSCCFAVKSIHPGIKLSFWKWDDNSVCHDLVCVSANRDIMTGKTAGKLWKFRVFTQNTSVGLNIQQIT